MRPLHCLLNFRCRIHPLSPSRPPSLRERAPKVCACVPARRRGRRRGEIKKTLLKKRSEGEGERGRARQSTRTGTRAGGACALTQQQLELRPAMHKVHYCIAVVETDSLLVLNEHMKDNRITSLATSHTTHPRIKSAD